MTTIDAQCASPMSQQPSAHTRSQLDVMMLLVRFPLLSVADLAFALGHSVAWTYGQMRALRAAGLAEPTSAPVCAPMCSTYSGRNIEGQMKTRVYAATLKGLEWIEAVSGSAVWRLATQTGADSVGLARLRRRLPAVLAVQSFVFALLRQIQQGTVALPRTDSKAGRSRFPTQLMWDWVRDPVLRYRWRARSMTMHVDAAVQLQVCLEMDKQSDEESLHRPTTVAAHELAVLYDGGLAEARDLRRRLLQLMQCREALAEENRGRCLPPLLILTPDARRAALWQALALQLATERWLTHPLIGGAVAWPASGAGSCDANDASDTPDHIWHDHTWRSLAQPTACDLASLLTTGATSIDLPNESALVECVTSRALQRVQRSANRRQVPQKAAHREALGATEMTARDLSVLQLLYAHPLLSAEELAAMLGIDPASSERYLRRLREAGLVTQRQFVLYEPALTIGGKTPTSPIQQRYALSAQGFAVVTMCAQAPGWQRLLRTVGDVKASAIQRLSLERDTRYQRYGRDVELLARTPDHTAGVYRFFALLHAAARTAGQSGYSHALA